MKRLLVIALILISSSFVFAETISRSAVITARKRGSSNYGQIPGAEAQIRLADASSADFGQGANVQLPIEARTEGSVAFSYFYTGNYYKGVSISFEFGPMKLLDEEQSLNGTYVYKDTVIPYTVYFEYGMTRIGNGAINLNKAPTNLRNEISYWGENNKYYIRYADSVTVKKNGTAVSGLSASASIVRTKASFSVENDLSVNSLIYDAATGGNSVSKTTFYSKFKDANNQNLTVVGDYWVRSGSFMVQINIDGTGEKWTVNDTNGTKPDVAAGVYYADVVVGFQTL